MTREDRSAAEWLSRIHVATIRDARCYRGALHRDSKYNTMTHKYFISLPQTSLQTSWWCPNTQIWSDHRQCSLQTVQTVCLKIWLEKLIWLACSLLSFSYKKNTWLWLAAGTEVVPRNLTDHFCLNGRPAVTIACSLSRLLVTPRIHVCTP